MNFTKALSVTESFSVDQQERERSLQRRQQRPLSANESCSLVAGVDVGAGARLCGTRSALPLRVPQRRRPPVFVCARAAGQLQGQAGRPRPQSPRRTSEGRRHAARLLESCALPCLGYYHPNDCHRIHKGPRVSNAYKVFVPRGWVD